MKNLGEFIDEKDIPRKEDIKVTIDTEKEIVIVGHNHISNGTTNTVVGMKCLTKNTTGRGNVALGASTLTNNINGNSNVAIGGALNSSASGSFNVAIGGGAGNRMTNSSYNVVIGVSASYNNIGGNIVAIGYKALYESAQTSYTNVIGIGAETMVTGSNQAQIGNSSVTVYCYGAVQNRSDKRDKTDIQDTNLGLNFLMKLKPREFRWDYREDYINMEEMQKELEAIETSEIEEEEKRNKIEEILKKYSLENIKKDGKKKGWRLHQGFIAQEVFETMRELGVDFGGYQDHSINGGKDVLSLGYEEFIPILVKGLQEQQEEIKELKSRIEKLEAK